MALHSLSVGPLSLPMPLVVAMLAMAAAHIATIIAKARQASDSLYILVLASLLAARVGFVLQYLPEYAQNGWAILQLGDGGWCWLCALPIFLIGLGIEFLRHPQARQGLLAAVVVGAVVLLAGWLALDKINQNAPAMPTAPLPLATGGSADLITLAQNRPAIVNLWASWCPHCVRELGILAAAEQQNPDIAVILVNQGEPAALAMDFLKNQNFAFQNSLLDASSSLMAALGSRGLPTTVFYDASGKQVALKVGALTAGSLAREIEKLKAAR